MSDAMNWNDRDRSEVFHPLPGARPAPRFARFVAGVDGEMWIEHFREDLSTPRRFTVVDRSGKAIGRISVPARMIPLEVGPAEVLGVVTDDDGLEHVVRYGLTRSPP